MKFTVDIDTPYEEWYNGIGFKTMRDRILNKVADVWRAEVRKSSGGRVHVRVHLNHDIPLIDLFALRAFLDDDPCRLACDLNRYYRTGDVEQTNRCFDEKYKHGSLRQAGKWMRFV